MRKLLLAALATVALALPAAAQVAAQLPPLDRALPPRAEAISRAMASRVDAKVAMDVVTKTGAWFTFGDTRLGQGREASKEFLRSHPEIAAEIDRRIPAQISEVAVPVEGIEEAE